MLMTKAEWAEEIRRRIEELAKLWELEVSGVRDGDGSWHGCFAPESAVHQLSKLLGGYLGFDEPRGCDPEFGCCSGCGLSAHCYLNIHRTHYMICKVCKTKWRAGENLFSVWQEETEDLWKRNAEILDEYEEIDPGAVPVRF